MARAIAYLRVSTSAQADEGLGLDIQRDKVTDYASKHGLELVDTVEEVASGGVSNGETFLVVTLDDELLCLDPDMGTSRWSYSAGPVPSNVRTMGSTPASAQVARPEKGQ